MHVGDGLLRGRGVAVLKGSLASVLPGCDDASKTLLHAVSGKHKLTFSVHGKVNLHYLPVEAEYCLQVGFHDIAGEIRDNDYFRIRICPW